MFAAALIEIPLIEMAPMLTLQPQEEGPRYASVLNVHRDIRNQGAVLGEQSREEGAK